MFTKLDEPLFISVKEAAYKIGVTYLRPGQIVSPGQLPAITRRERIFSPAPACENFVTTINRQISKYGAEAEKQAEAKRGAA